MEDWEKEYRVGRAQRHFGCLGLIVIPIIWGYITLSPACHQDPKAKVYDTVTVNSNDMTYDIAFACRREEREKDLCIKRENLESVFINKRDSWSVRYSTSPTEYDHPLLPQMQEQAWNMADAEQYLRIYAEGEQK